MTEDKSKKQDDLAPDADQPGDDALPAELRGLVADPGGIVPDNVDEKG